MSIANIIFYLFSSVLVASALAVVTMRNPVHSVLFLILAFFNAAGLFILLGAEFLAMLLVIVYVGAVAVLFLFVVMMLNVSVERFRQGLSKYSRIGALVALVILLELGFIYINGSDSLVFGSQIASPINYGITNTQSLGRVIYTDYLLLFQASGLVLLVAMIGAIVLTFTPRDKMRKQNIAQQNSRKPSKTMQIVKVKPKQGI